MTTRGDITEYIGITNAYGWRPGEQPKRPRSNACEDARFMMCAYTSTHEAVGRVLPAPLEPGPDALVAVTVADYPFAWTMDGVNRPYIEVIFFVQCMYQREVGVTIPFIYIGSRTGDLTDGCETPIYLGRELFGFPKKLANISINRDGQEWVATMRRRRVDLLKFRANFDAPVERDALPTAALGRIFLVKEIGAADLRSYDVRKVLALSSDWLREPKSALRGSATVELGHLDEDPLDVLEVVRPGFALEMVSDTRGDLDAEEVADLGRPPMVRAGRRMVAHAP